MAPVRLAVFDLDGTLRRVPDPWLHIHQALGTHVQGHEFYERWQRGTLTYPELCRMDASLWQGISRERLVAASVEANPLRRGAAKLVGWFAARGIPCVGISTGLSLLHDLTAAETGLRAVFCNHLGFHDESCDGTVRVHVHEEAKMDALRHVLAEYQVTISDTVVFGDGLADIPLLRGAGIGIAVCPRQPEVSEAADWTIDDEPIDTAIDVLLTQVVTGDFDRA